MNRKRTIYKCMVLYASTSKEFKTEYAKVKKASASGYKVKTYRTRSKVGGRVAFRQEVYCYAKDVPEDVDFRREVLEIKECSKYELRKFAVDIEECLNKDAFKHKFNRNYLGEGQIKATAKTRPCDKKVWVWLWVLTKEITEEIKADSVMEQHINALFSN